jgi:hypothetical protein
MPNATPTASVSQSSIRRRRRVRRLLFLLAIAGAGLAAAVSYASQAVAGSAGQTQRSSLLTELSPGTPLPPGVRSLRYPGAASWSGAPGVAAAVTRPGNVALVDTTGRRSALTVTVYLSNLPAVQLAYRSVLIPVGVWESTKPAGAGSWRPLPGTRTFLSDAVGKVDFTLPPGGYYDIAIERGGSLVAAPGAADYSADFYVALSA